MASEIIVPRENVNDDSMTLLRWLVGDGVSVEGNQPVAELETSKAVLEIESPEKGILRHGKYKPGDDINVGAVLAWVSEDGTIPDSADNSEPTDPNRTPTQTKNIVQSMRISSIARKMMEEHGIAPESFQGTSQVRTRDVEDFLAKRESTDPSVLAQGKPARFSKEATRLMEKHQVDPAKFDGFGLVRSVDVLNFLKPAKPATLDKLSFQTIRPSRSKRAEIQALEAGSSSALTSVITVACPTRGFQKALDNIDVLSGNSTALILFEVARLLKKFPHLNGFFADESFHLYDEINIGFAIDAGHGLKVPVIRNADSKSMEQIDHEMNDLVIAYSENRLGINELTGATFTITDLSGEDVFTFHPLIPGSQSAILGVGGQFMPPGSPEGYFNLIIAFDHQMTEGRAASKFLNSLRNRLNHYESAFGSSDGDENLCCDRCYRTVSDLSKLKAFLVPWLGSGKPGSKICSICLRGH